MSEAREPGTSGVRAALGNAAGALLFPVIAIVILFVTGDNPISAYAALLEGAVGSPAAIGRTVLNATPLVFTGLAVAFQAGLFNIGGEGQLFIGAITAAWLGFSLSALGLGAIPLVLAGCIVTGFLWGSIPGVLKAYFGAHEVITTIMLNFIAINLAYYLAQNPLRREGPIPGTETIDAAARIPLIGFGLGRANWGVLIALLAAAFVYVFLWRTRRGFELRAVGLSPGAANYAGMSLGVNVVLALAIGGARRLGRDLGRLRQHGRTLCLEPRLQRHRGRCSSPPTCPCSSPACSSPSSSCSSPQRCSSS